MGNNKQRPSYTKRLWGTAQRVALVAVAGILIGACIGSDSDSDDGDDGDEAVEGTSSPVGTSVASSAFIGASSGIPLVTGSGGTGAGLLIEGGYIVTSTEIIGSGSTASVRFSGEDDAFELTVAAVHPLADVVLLGPLETEVEPPAIADLDEFEIGSALYAIGYVTGDKDAAILQTILSGTTHWEAGELTQVRIDTTRIALSSPSFVVSDDGAVVAIRNNSGSPTGLGTPLSELADALTEMVGTPVRTLDAEESLAEQTVELDGLTSEQLYAFTGTEGKPVTLVLDTESGAIARLDIYGPSGALATSVTEFVEGRGQVTMTPDATGGHTAVVRYAGSEPAVFVLSSDAGLSQFNDPDDGQSVSAGTRIVGALDYSGDVDVFLLDLRPGEQVTLRVEGLTVDPLIQVAPLGEAEPATDDSDGTAEPAVTDDAEPAPADAAEPASDDGDQPSDSSETTADDGEPVVSESAQTDDDKGAVPAVAPEPEDGDSTESDSAVANGSIADDDSGGGLFGTAAQMELNGGDTGITYVIRVSDALLEATGGYVLVLEGASNSQGIQSSVTTLQDVVGLLQETEAGQDALMQLFLEIDGSFAAGLPSASGAAWRGTVQGDALTTQLATTDTDDAGATARSVADEDGAFTVRATILASGTAEAAISVVNSQGTEVASGTPRLAASCGEGRTCVAAISVDILDVAALGPWTVSLAALDGTILSWQLEVHRQPGDVATSTLPAE